MARRCRSTSRTIPGSENQALETKGLSIFACCGTPHTPVFCCKSAQTIDFTELTISLFAKERRKSAQVTDYMKLSFSGSADEDWRRRERTKLSTNPLYHASQAQSWRVSQAWRGFSALLVA